MKTKTIWLIAFTTGVNSILDLLQTTLDYIKSIPIPIPTLFLDTIVSDAVEGAINFSSEIIMQLVGVSS